MFKPLERLINLHDGYRQAFQVEGRPLLLLMVDNQPVLLENRCPHQDVPLHTASLTGHMLRCSRHGIEFDLRSGRASAPSCPGLNLLKVAYDGDRIGLDL